MPSTANQTQVQQLSDKLAKAKSMVVIEYSGTTVNDQTKLRSQVTEVGGEVVVAKNTLMDIALGKGKLSDALKGMNAFVFGYEDAVGAIKKVFDFNKESSKLVIKAGLLEDKVLSATEVENLSKLPSKQELLATLVQRIQSPATGMVNVLKAPVRDLVQVLRAYSQKEN